MKPNKRIKKLKPVPTNCIYCNNKIEPDYKDKEGLAKYLTERGKILSKARTGLCAKHERHVAESIKHARYIGLLPFMVRPR